MRLAFLTAAALMSTMVSTEALAASGKSLHDLCEGNQFAAIVYATAIDDAYLYSETNMNYCIPGKVTNEQLGLVVCKWLRDNPQEHHTSAALSVIKSFRKAWPCN
jgi:hypothetical protein